MTLRTSTDSLEVDVGQSLLPTSSPVFASLGVGTGTGTLLGLVDLKASTNNHLLVAGADHLTSGMSIRTLNDAGNANLQLEIEASNWEITNANIPSLDFGITTAGKLTTGKGVPFGIAGAVSGQVYLVTPSVAGANTITLPAVTGTAVTTGDSGSITSGMLASGLLLKSPTIQGTASNSPAAILAASEWFAGRDVNNTIPAGMTTADIAFQFGGAGGGFRHWLVTKHNSAATSNEIDFYLNTSGTAGGSSAPGTGSAFGFGMSNAGIIVPGAGAGRSTIAYANSASNTTQTIPATTGTIAVSGSLAHTQSSVAAPAGTTSTVGVMMGLAGSVTPTNSGTIRISVVGDITNSISGDGGNVQLRIGGGAAPANGAALTGTAFGSLRKYVAASATDKKSFGLTWTVTGQAIGTALWIDVGLAAVTGGTCTIADVDIIADELP